MWEQHPFFLEQAAKAKYESLLQEAEVERKIGSQLEGSPFKLADFRRALGSLLIIVGQKVQGSWGSRRIRALQQPAACGCCQGAR